MPSLREIAIGLLVAGLGGAVVLLFSCPLAALLATVGIGCVLLVLDTAWRYWQRPKKIAQQLDAVAIYIITTRREAESKALLDEDFVLGPFDARPPDTRGTYGPFSHKEAWRGFERLRALGVIERESYDTETGMATYRWTKLGERIAARL